MMNKLFEFIQVEFFQNPISIFISVSFFYLFDDYFFQ